MGLFSKFNSGNTKEQFFSGWEVHLDGGEHCQSFLLSQCIEKEAAPFCSSYIHLVFGEDDLLKSGKLYLWGERTTSGHVFEHLQLDKAIGKLVYKEIAPNRIYNFVEDPEGMHQLGGETPSGFQFPDNKLKIQFQYLGYLDNKDTPFQWLPFGLHLIYPLFLNILHPLFIDYSNPDKPVIINREEAEKADPAYSEVDQDTRVTFTPVKFNTAYAKEQGGMGHTGSPGWFQYPEFPYCPRTGKLMKFVCELHSDIVPVKESNIVPSSDFMAHYFEGMNFWGDGVMYIFFEPQSKVACYFIMNT